MQQFRIDIKEKALLNVNCRDNLLRMWNTKLEHIPQGARMREKTVCAVAPCDENSSFGK